MKKNIEVVLDGGDLLDINRIIDKVQSMLLEGVKFNNISEEEVIDEIEKMRHKYFN